MDKTIRTPIVTARAADRHFQMIKTQHSDLVTGMQNQAIKIAALNEQKRVEQMNQNQADNQMKMEQQSETQKMNMAFQTEKLKADLKNRELSIKQSALSNG